MMKRWIVFVCLVGLVAGTAGCSSSSKSASPTTTVNPKGTGGTTTTTPAPPLTVVITDDDGIGAEGIDVLAKAIQALDGVKVTVVAPAKNQSASGDKQTPGGAKYHPGETASGIKGTAVEGYPADSITVALDDLGLHPDLVASGINRGQNVGPLADISRTVGAAMTATRRGIPAISGSAGLVEHPDYEGAAALVVAWIKKNRIALAASDMSTKVVVNINVPECTKGQPNGVVAVPPAKVIPKGVNPFSADCSATPDSYKPDNDVDALAHGFAAHSEIPVTAASPPS